jgi:hypothetical protein
LDEDDMIFEQLLREAESEAKTKSHMRQARNNIKQQNNGQESQNTPAKDVENGSQLQNGNSWVR